MEKILFSVILVFVSYQGVIIDSNKIEVPLKSKERWNASAQYYEPTRRNQIIDSVFTPKGINQIKFKEHARTIRKMLNDREYLSREKELPPPMTGTLAPWKNDKKN